MELSVMTYNLKFDDQGTATTDSWKTRRPIMARLLTTQLPHLLGTQEGLYGQVSQIHEDLSRQQKRRYAWIGEGRRGGSHDEFMAVFYDSDRLVPQEYEHFWIYKDPLTVGEKWDAASGSPRMVTWVRFKDTATNPAQEFYLINTHADDQSEGSRQASANNIRNRMSNTLRRPPGLNTSLPTFDTTLPCIVTGDFNVLARKGEPVYDILLREDRLQDAWVVAKEKGPAYATWNDWKAPREVDERADWILTTPGITVSSASINTFRENGQWPSDHCPVQATLTLPAPH